MTETPPIRKGQRYRRLVLGVFALGIVALLGGMVVDQTLAGLVVYAAAAAAGILATLYLDYGTAIPLYDEREIRLYERASHATINLLAYVGLPIVIGIYLLDATGQYDIGPTLAGVIYAYSALGLLWGAVYLVYRLRA